MIWNDYSSDGDKKQSLRLNYTSSSNNSSNKSPDRSYLLLSHVTIITSTLITSPSYLLLQSSDLKITSFLAALSKSLLLLYLGRLSSRVFLQARLRPRIQIIYKYKLLLSWTFLHLFAGTFTSCLASSGSVHYSLWDRFLSGSMLVHVCPAISAPMTTLWSMAFWKHARNVTALGR